MFVCVGECGLPVLDAPGSPAQLQYPDPDDPALSASTAHLCAGPTHETCRLRTHAQLQGDLIGESTNSTVYHVCDGA